MFVFLSPRFGVVNTIIQAIGFEPVFFMGDPNWGKTLYVLSSVWQTAGYGAIIYLAALSGVDTSTKEAAYCDGASKFQIMMRVEIPWIMPTIIILFIMRIGRLLTIGWEKVLLMQNDMNISKLEVVSTYVYRSGILESQYDYAAAVGFVQTVLNFVLLLSANKIAKRMGQESLW
jgi:putative aldouronate transport system permease protein